jgi:XRE family transcriptional regulator, fatty acid utilization regulator
MAEQKIFAGPRIRRIRKEKDLTQTAMAEAIGISPSYLNLIERNQRPLTVQLILKLATTFKIDLEDLQGGAGGSVADLREVFSDPLLSAELPGPEELIEVAEAAPNAAAAMIKLYRAYREGQERLTDLSTLLAKDGRAMASAGARLPLDEVQEVLAGRANHFIAIEDEAESFLHLLKPGADLDGALKGWLQAQHGVTVRVLPVETMPNWRRRYDRHSQRLFISERLSPFDQVREIAMEAALLRMQVAIAAEIESLKLSSPEARRIARFEMARYAAHALMMPYPAFLSAAQKAKHDIDVLRSRFRVSFEQAANRLTTLSRTGASGIPFFMLEIDQAGNRFRRAGAGGYPHSKFGGFCPKLPVHAAFAQPQQILVESVQMPDDGQFLVIARTLEGPHSTFHERPRRTAILLGCDLAHKNEIVYSEAILPVKTPIGPSCRLCERAGCLSRAAPPITKPLGLDEMVSGLSVFDFV